MTQILHLAKFAFLFLSVLFPFVSCAGPTNLIHSTDSGEAKLAAEFFEEGNRRACRTECARILIEYPEHKQAFLIKAMSEFRLGKNTTAAAGFPSSRFQKECLVETKKEPKPFSPAGKFGEWLISFYRSQIGPALGRRCSLHPSCSEYARQAFRKHGLLGVALIGDRSVREPGVVAEKKSPVRINGTWKYGDPLEEHDWWMNRGK